MALTEGSTEIFASNSEKSGSGHGSHVAASAMADMDGRGHGGHVTNLPISETRKLYVTESRTR